MEILNKIQKELKAPKNQVNSFGGYKYRSCEEILEAVKPLLGKATLVISDEIVCLGESSPQVTESYPDKNGIPQIIRVGGSKIYVKATATLKYGEEIEIGIGFAREADNKKGMDEAQITGSASSYARKYALNGLFLIDDTKDSDVTNEQSNGVTNLNAIEQRKLINDMWISKDFDQDAFFKHFDIGGKEELSERQLPLAISGLQDKKNKELK